MSPTVSPIRRPLFAQLRYGGAPPLISWSTALGSKLTARIVTQIAGTKVRLMLCRLSVIVLSLSVAPGRKPLARQDGMVVTSVLVHQTMHSGTTADTAGSLLFRDSLDLASGNPIRPLTAVGNGCRDEGLR